MEIDKITEEKLLESMTNIKNDDIYEHTSAIMKKIADGINNDARKIDKEFFKKFKEITEETAKKFRDMVESKAVNANSDLYYIVGIGFYRNGAELTSKDYVVYPPKIVNSIESNYKNALLTSVYMMEEAEDRLKDTYMKQICYPIKVVDNEVSASIENGTFFNREMHYNNAVQVFNSDEYINTLISTKTYEALDKSKLKDSIYVFLTNNPEERIASRIEEIGKAYNDRKILENFGYEVDNSRIELFKLSAELQNTIDKYQGEEACKDELEILMNLQDSLVITEGKMLELVMGIGLKES